MSGDTGPVPPAFAPALHRALGVVAVLSALVVAILGVLLAGQTVPGAVDTWISASMGDPSVPARDAALVIDFGGEPVGAAILVTTLAVLCLAVRLPRLALLAVGCLVPAAVTVLLKHVIGRTVNGGHLSYPSGHTALATALALVLGLLVVEFLHLGRASAILLVVGVTVLGGAAMAWAQVTLDAHYPTDTLGGFGTALACVPAMAVAIDKAAERFTHGAGTPA